MLPLIGNTKLREKLFQTIEESVIPHAQLFTGTSGAGQLRTAIEFAQKVLSQNNEMAIQKVAQLQHADLHFSFPTINTETKKNISDNYIQAFRTFAQQQTYGSVFDWLKSLEIENKQGIIGVDEAENIVKKLSLKSYEGGYKIMIIWGADYLNTAAANKLLKIIEEPPAQTLFILIAEQEEAVLETIRSRTQITQFKQITTDEIIATLQQQHENIALEKAQYIAHQAQGNYHKALISLHENFENEDFEHYFVDWIRNAFMAKTQPHVLQNLVRWATEIHTWGRERQKQFLQYALEVFRQALMANYQVTKLQFITIEAKQFNWEKFIPYIHGQNILEIIEELNTAYYHIERNANAKLIFLDTSIKITRYLHRKNTIS